MATWSKTKVTEAGLEMNAQALASGESIEVTSANGFAADKPLQSVAAFDIAGITRQGQAAVVTLQIDNATTETARRFNRIVLFAKLGEGPGESAPYAWIETDGGEMETIPAKSEQYKVLRVDVVLAFTGAENVTVTPTVNLGITKEQAQKMDAAAVDEHDKDPAAHQALAHSIVDTDTPRGNNGTIRKLLDRLANRIKAITGRGRWFDAPDITLAQTKERLDGIDTRIRTLDFIPTKKIGTNRGDLAELSWNGRFDKARLPSDVVYDSDFSASTGADGYVELPNGIIIQWGYISLSSMKMSQTKSAYFPRTFPTSCYNLSVTEYGPDSESDGKDDWYFHVKDFSRSGFSFILASGSNDRFIDTSSARCYYMAIGR